MSVALANQAQSQDISLDDPSKSPILKGKHIKDGKEILSEIVKDTAKAKAKMAEHLCQVMAELKAAGIADPLQNLSKNPAWQNFISADPATVHVTTKSDEMNMYMEIFKALNMCAKSSNISSADEAKHMLAQNALSKLLQGGNDQALKDMEATIDANRKAIEDAKSDDSFWGIFTRVLTAIVVVALVVAIPFTGGTSAAVAVGIVAIAVTASEEFLIQPKVIDAHTIGDAINDANAKSSEATSDMSTKITINSNALQAVQNTIQSDSQNEQNAESDKESELNVAKSVIQAMAKSAVAV